MILPSNKPALKSQNDLSTPMEIAEFKIGDFIPEKMKKVLPTIKELEEELSSK